MKKTTSVIIVGLFYVLLVWIYGGWVRDDRHTSIKAPQTAQDGRTAEDRLIDALIAIESNGDDSAIGDGGLAVGCLQIHPIMVRDINRILGREYINCPYIYKDRYNRTKSIEMCKIYFGHYCRDTSDEYKARCWNGGPNGWKKESTKAYWEKVKAVLYE